MIEVDWNSLDEDLTGRACALTIGVFDGLHPGHQRLIRPLVDGEDRAVVVTFERHPTELLLHDRVPGYVMSIRQRRAMLDALGVDLVVLVDFTDSIREMSGIAFMEHLLSRLPVRRMVVGYDFAIGTHRQTGIEDLRSLLLTKGIDLSVASPLMDHGHPVSSSRVRSHIQAGELDHAAQLLGRPFTLDLAGESIQGAGDEALLSLERPEVLNATLQLLPPAGDYPVELIDNSGRSRSAILHARRNSLRWPLSDGRSIRYIVMNHRRIEPKE